MLFYKVNSTIKIHKEIVLFFNPAICSLKKKKNHCPDTGAKGKEWKIHSTFIYIKNI